MGRAKQNLIVVHVDVTTGALLATPHGEDEAAARAELDVAVKKGVKAKLFDGVELPFEQGIIIGRREGTPKRRGKRKAKPEVTGPAPANGQHEPTPPLAAPQDAPTTSAARR